MCQHEFLRVGGELKVPRVTSTAPGTDRDQISEAIRGLNGFMESRTVVMCVCFPGRSPSGCSEALRVPVWRSPCTIAAFMRR